MIIPKIADYPKTIYIRGDAYALIFVKDMECLGETHARNHTIKVRAGMSRNETFRTVIHEILHAMEFSHPVKLKHKTVYKLEEAIFQFFIDNFT